MSEPRPAASAKEQFELLYNDLRSLQESFVDGAIKMTGFQVIVLGWLITAESVSTALRGNAATFLATLAAIVVGSSIYVAISLRAYRASHRIFGLLQSLAYMPTSHFQTRVIKRITFSLLISAHLLLALMSGFVATWYFTSQPPSP